MNRYEQRRAAALRNPEISAGYREMDAEIALLHVLDEARKSLIVEVAPPPGKVAKRDDPRDKGYMP